MSERYPSYCCQECGDCIGWLGRFFQWLLGRFAPHSCKGSPHDR
jgi:hypothetical protein